LKDTKILKQTEIEYASKVIKNGGLVIFPTETVYGLGADALNEDASKNIYLAKGRPSDNPLICHLAFPEDAEKYCQTNELYYSLAEHFMPGPITVILPKKKSEDGTPIIPNTTSGGLDSVAVRIPSNPIAHELILRSGVPIAAPSANLSGSPSPTTLRHVVEDMMGRVDCIIDGGDSDIGVESTIVMIDGNKLKLLRPGGITIEMLSQLADVEVDDAVIKKSDARPLAPGMKYRHYAPKSQVIILDGDDNSVYEFLSDKKDFAMICFDEDLDKINTEIKMSIGKKDDYASHAHKLFSTLRDIDGHGIIYARMPSKNGVDFAVFNRLIKAAGYEIKQL